MRRDTRTRAADGGAESGAASRGPNGLGQDSGTARRRASGARGLLFALTLWSIAFGWIEAAVVVYLRDRLYPHGFGFPLASIPSRLYNIELAREVATIVLLWGVAWLSDHGQGPACEARRGAVRSLRRQAAFAFCFGVWDLVYYLGLRATLGWPASLLDWDVLFLIPGPWTGPVLAPLLVSMALIAGGSIVLLRSAPAERVFPPDPEGAMDGGRGPDPARRPAGSAGLRSGASGGSGIEMRAADWAVEIIAGLVIVVTFLWNVAAVARGDVPRFFPWPLFLVALAGGFGWFLFRTMRRRR